MRTRLCLCYVAGYLLITGLALLIAPDASLRLMGSTADYGDVMPRWVAMMSLALGALIGQTVRHRLQVLYPLGFFMPAAMLAGFVGLSQGIDRAVNGCQIAGFDAGDAEIAVVQHTGRRVGVAGGIVLNPVLAAGSGIYGASHHRL